MPAYIVSSLSLQATGAYPWATDFIESGFVEDLPPSLLQSSCVGLPDPLYQFSVNDSVYSASGLTKLFC